MSRQFKQFNVTTYYVFENVKNDKDKSKFNYFIHSEELNRYISYKRAGKPIEDIAETNEIETIIKHGINIPEYKLQAYFPVHKGNISEYSNKNDLIQIYKYTKILSLLHCLLINEHDEVLENNTDVIVDRDNVIIIKSQLLDANLLKYICYNKRFANKVQYKEGTFENKDIIRTKMELDVEYKTNKYTLNPDALPLIYYPHSVKRYIKENITFNEDYLKKLNINDDYLIKNLNENESLSDESLNKIHHTFVENSKNEKLTMNNIIKEANEWHDDIHKNDKSLATEIKKASEKIEILNNIKDKLSEMKKINEIKNNNNELIENEIKHNNNELIENENEIDKEIKDENEIDKEIKDENEIEIKDENEIEIKDENEIEIKDENEKDENEIKDEKDENEIEIKDENENEIDEKKEIEIKDKNEIEIKDENEISNTSKNISRKRFKNNNSKRIKHKKSNYSIVNTNTNTKINENKKILITIVIILLSLSSIAFVIFTH